MDYFHSVTLEKDKCLGCTNCITRCPTEAIRVQNGKAKIIKERCIDCGECVRVCKSHAKNVTTDGFEMLEKFKYNIAMPAPTFYSQFSSEISVNKILNGFIKIGFDDVFEVARGAEYVSAATRQILAEGKCKKPVISSACPAVLRLIRERFPNLLDNILPLISPMEAAARLAREEAVKKTGLADEEIGVFFITPCPAKVTSIKAPLTVEKSSVSGAIAVKDAFAKIYPLIEKIDEEKNLAVSGSEGIFWARSGGECRGTGVEDYIAVDGIHNVIKVL
jgi:iron only hydrogenase large subunit-like protein